MDASGAPPQETAHHGWKTPGQSQYLPRQPSPWIVEPIRHPFQLTPTSNAHLIPSSNIISNTHLHSGTNHIAVYPNLVASRNNPISPHDTYTEQQPPSHATIASRGSSRKRRIDFELWVSHNRSLSLLILSMTTTLLSVIHIVVGHAIFQAAQPSSYRIASLSSSAKAGAIGGAVITLPVVFLLHFIQCLCIERSDSSGPDDFFDDDSDTGNRILWRRMFAYVVIILMTVFMGVVTGPIGVSVLKATTSIPMLSVAQSAAASVIGGLISFPIVIAFVLYWMTSRGH
ncbi:MAG: hypothetical protein NXY57DRAFT_997239 [Lentinula lateritia]|nr:MAG: hypothetical protein NXY57DRAFT_997239 [Lentinula lateritia]